MIGLPTLTVYMFPSIQSKQYYCLKLMLSSPKTNVKEIDAGKLELPFPSDMVPLIQYLVNLKQEHDKPSQLGAIQSSELPNKPSISNTQNDMLSRLKLLDNKGRVVDDVHEKLGEQLGLALLNNQVFKDNLQEFYQDVRETNGGDIVLKFDQAVLELTALPWELAFDGSKPLLVPQEAQTVLGCTRIIFNRSLPSTSQPLLSAKQYPPLTYSAYDKLRILAVASTWTMNNDDQIRERYARLQLKEAFKGIAVEVEPFPHVTMSALANRLDSGPRVDILDYFGHGFFENGHAVLQMEDDNRGVDPVSPARLKILENLPPVVILYACHSAQVDFNNSLDSFAYSLNNKGVQAVVAMQFKIRMQVVAEHVVWTFYNALADGCSLPQALAEVRRKLLVEEKEENAVSWFVPVLYLREFNQQPYILLEEAPDLPLNPFIEGSAVDNPNLFVGRKLQLQQIWEKLRLRGSLSIVGPEGSGKTAILTQLATQGAKRLDVEVVWLSLQVDWTPARARLELALLLGGKNEAELTSLLEGRRLVLLLDSLDTLDTVDKRALGIRVWLRSLTGNRLGRLVQLVVTSSQKLDIKFRNDKPQSLHSIMGTPIELGSLSMEEGQDFISARLKEVGYPFEVKDFEDLLLDPQLSLIPRDLENACQKRYEELCKSQKKRARILFR